MCSYFIVHSSWMLRGGRGVRGTGYGKNYDKLYGYCWMPTSIPDNRTCDVTGAIDLLCLNNLYRGLMSVKGSLTTVQRWHTASIKCFRKGNNFDDKFCMLSMECSALGNPKVGGGGGIWKGVDFPQRLIFTKKCTSPPEIGFQPFHVTLLLSPIVNHNSEK